MRQPGEDFQDDIDDTLPLNTQHGNKDWRAAQEAARQAAARHAEQDDTWEDENRRHAYADASYATKRPHKKHSCLGRVIRLALVLCLVGIIALIGNLYFWDQKKQDLPVPAAADGNVLDPIDKDLLFLLAGVDDIGTGEPQRTDTLLLVRYDFSDGRLIGLSIPRDSRVFVRGKRDKINHAHAYGGIALTMQTIRDFLGIDLDYYMEVDYDTVKSVVDAVGGVRYNVPQEAQPVPGEIFHTGDHVLNGDETLSFLRHRQGYKNGDIDRVKAQQAFLKETAHQVVSPLNIRRMPFVLKAIQDHAKTNIPALPLLSKAPGVLFTGLPEMEMHTIPGHGQTIGGLSYYVPDKKGTKQMVRKLLGPFMQR